MIKQSAIILIVGFWAIATIFWILILLFGATAFVIPCVAFIVWVNCMVYKIMIGENQ